MLYFSAIFFRLTRHETRARGIVYCGIHCFRGQTQTSLIQSLAQRIVHAFGAKMTLRRSLLRCLLLRKTQVMCGPATGVLIAVKRLAIGQLRTTTRPAHVSIL